MAVLFLSKLKSLMMRPSQVINMKLIKKFWYVFWSVPFAVGLAVAVICVGIGQGFFKMHEFMDDIDNGINLRKSKGE